LQRQLKSKERQEKLEEQRHASRLLDQGRWAAAIVFTAVVVFFLYVSILRASAPFAFIPAFLTATLVMIFSIAYVLTVMIRKDI
jgi:fatty acid desaturase